MKTQIGLPVQLFANTTKGREVFAAIIVDLRDSPHAETDLMVFSRDEKPTSIFVPCIRHKDFKKDGENYWDFLEEEKFQRDEIEKTPIGSCGGSKRNENLEYEWQDATKEKPCPAIGFKNLSPKVMVKTPLGVGTGYHNSSDNDWLVNINGEEFQSYKGVTHWKFIKQVKDDYIFGKMVKIIDNWKDNYNDNMKEVEKTEDIFKYTPEDRKQKVSNALKKVKQWMSLMNRINNDYNRLSTAIVLITNEVDVTEQDVLDICTELYYKCKLEKFNTVLSEAVFISEFSKMKIDKLKEAKVVLTKKDSSDIEIAKYTKSDLRMAFASGIDFAVVNDGLDLTSKFRDIGFNDMYNQIKKV